VEESRPVKDTTLLEEAEAISALMPALARGLFALNNDVAAELPLAQLRVCGVLEEGPRSMSALSRELGVSLSAMTQIADRLERSQWVRRVTEDKDRRVRCLQLTPEGEALMRQRKTARVQRILAALSRLSIKERAQVSAAFETLVRASHASQGPQEAGASNGSRAHDHPKTLSNPSKTLA
jgi:DNA-binding MarR family transcriptional regulator